MATPHPYMSGTHNIAKMINYLRKEGLPNKFSKQTLKKAKIPLSYNGRLINALQFVGVIDGGGKHDDNTARIFAEDDRKFANGFATMVEKSYSQLFKEHGEEAWTITKEQLTTFFRQVDNKAEVIADWQAKTFLAFASLSNKSSEVEQDSTKEKFAKVLANLFTKNEDAWRKQSIEMFAKLFAENEDALLQRPHQLQERDIHPKIQEVSKKAFDGGHFSNATLRACIILEKTVRELSGNKNRGAKLMNYTFNADNPKLRLSNSNDDKTSKDEQEGYRSLFYGTITAIRNPSAHELVDGNVDQCLDHLSLVSMLMRKLDAAQENN